MADRGWHAIDVARASERTGHPMRTVSTRTLYRVIAEGYVPLAAAQFETAAVFGLLPSHIWGQVLLPEPYAYLNGGTQVAA